MALHFIEELVRVGGFDVVEPGVVRQKLLHVRLIMKEGISLIEIFLGANLAKSKRAARDLINQGGAYVNNVAWRDVEARVNMNQVLSGRAILLRSGKKTYHLLIVG